MSVGGGASTPPLVRGVWQSDAPGRAPPQRSGFSAWQLQRVGGIGGLAGTTGKGALWGGDCGDWPRGRARFLVFSPHPSPSTPFSSGNRRGPSAAMAHGETRLVWSRSTPAAAATTMPEPRPLAPLALTPISHTPTGTSNGNGGHDQAVDNGTPRSPPPFARLDGEWTPARPSRSVRALSGRAR